MLICAFGALAKKAIRGSFKLKNMLFKLFDVLTAQLSM